MKAKPSIVLRDWSDGEKIAVTTLKIYLDAEARIVGFEFASEKGYDAQAALVAMELGRKALDD